VVDGTDFEPQPPTSHRSLGGTKPRHASRHNL
jgi:hypothetical protein